ncbi:MAG: DUF805 domain-containing protein [Selenomonadaceae bacterium]|nr:DUF805 domain-containing protein [Selenomonadaceae bacterium]
MERVLKQYIFAPEKRLNRKRYILYALAYGLVMALVTGILTFVAALIFGENSFMVRAVTFVTSLAWFAGYVSLMIQRLHDLARPSWWAVGTLIPVVNFVLALYLLLVPGTRGYNKYGPDPLRY